MDSYLYTPEQRFFSASDTSKLVASTNGIIDSTAKSKPFKTEYIFYGILAVGVILAVSALVTNVKKNSLSEEKINV